MLVHSPQATFHRKISDNFVWIHQGRSSRPEVFCKKSFLINIAKLQGKHLCQGLFFNKIADLRTATLLKKRLWYRCFPGNFVKFLRTENLRWLLLSGPTFYKEMLAYGSGTTFMRKAVSTMLEQHIA